MESIVTALALPGPAANLLKAVGELNGPDDWAGHLAEATGLVGTSTVKVNEDLLNRAPKLRIYANSGVGYDHIDIPACREHGVTVTNTPDVLTDATADLAFALLLSAVRRLPQAEKSLRTTGFQGWGFWDRLSGDITGNTLGIFGMGRTGAAVAKRAVPFGLQVQYNSRTRLPVAREQELGLRWVDFDTLVATSDILSLHAPYSASTHHILDAKALSRMKPGSYLINAARGALIDEAALVEVLRSGHLAGAGLDVYEHEPKVNPGLFELDNVTLLPHIGSATPKTRAAMVTLACRNVNAFFTQGKAITPVLEVSKPAGR